MVERGARGANKKRRPKRRVDRYPVLRTAIQVPGPFQPHHHAGVGGARESAVRLLPGRYARSNLRAVLIMATTPLLMWCHHGHPGCLEGSLGDLPSRATLAPASLFPGDHVGTSSSVCAYLAATAPRRSA